MNKTREIFTGARIIGPQGILEDQDLVICEGRIEALLPRGEGRLPEDRVLDVQGAYLMPGIMDIHSDYIEHLAAPRPTSLMDFGLSLRVAEREMVSHGITTMFHSMSLHSISDFDHRPIRKPENSKRFIDLIARRNQEDPLLRHRFHARLEIDEHGRLEEIAGYLREGGIHLLSFMDHTPGQGQYRDLEVYRKTLKGYRNLEDEQIDQIISRSQAKEKVTLDQLKALADLARENGVALASHDDDTVEKLDLVSQFGTAISEFPITLEVAREARRRGLETVAGAPNVLLGGSHSGNLSATEAIVDGSVSVLCSDYYPSALLQAVFLLHFQKGLPLHEMVNLVTLNPARAVGMDSELGSLEPGKAADLLVVELDAAGYPGVSLAYCQGRRVFGSAEGLRNLVPGEVQGVLQ